MWDSEWEPDKKKESIKLLSAADFDTVIDKIRDNILSYSKGLQELNLIIDLYNEGHNALPQSKSMDDAPSILVVSDINKNVLESICNLGKTLNFTTVSVASGSKYFEDVIEGLQSRYIGTRVSMGAGMYVAITDGREKRGITGKIPKEEVGAAAADGEEAKVQSDRLLKEIEFTLDGGGLLQGRHVYLRCPIEGGNMLTGNDFIIVGMDSLYATMNLYHVNETTATAMMAEDFNITSEKVYIVEQPGEFHLDMAMTLVTNNTVLIKTPDGTSRGELISETIRNLEKYRFKVIEDKGRAVGSGFNFLNGEFVKSSDGKIYFLTNAPEIADEDDKQGTFKKFLKDEFPKIEDVIFVQDSLSTEDCGGLGCRVKGMPGTIRKVISK